MTFANSLIEKSSLFLQEWPLLGRELGINLSVQRDDLLPFSLAGNKWVKLLGHMQPSASPRVYISNGGINSNHCRTIALWAAQNGDKAHLVLHGQNKPGEPPLDLLSKLGCRFDVVPPNRIAAQINQLTEEYSAAGFHPTVIAGGGHSPEGVSAYKTYARDVIQENNPQFIVHASGTGGTQAGLIAACESLGSQAQVIGISVARRAEAGKAAIVEALSWLGAEQSEVDFRDQFTDGGYGVHGAETTAATAYAWSHGLPLDKVYTGKAFAGLLNLTKHGTIPRGSKVLFWHTGGSYISFQDK